VLEIFALFMFMGIFTTLCIPETARKTLEELAGEDISGASSEDIQEISKEPAVEEKITA
jgi:MFS transporter, PHS family, inorganic phosphate transporter